MEKYIDPRNLVVSVQIGNFLVSNVLINLGVAINVMTKQTMDQLRLSHLRPTPTVLELADRSKIKPEGVLEDVIISLDSWEYPTDFIVLQQKNTPYRSESSIKVVVGSEDVIGRGIPSFLSK